MTMNGDDFALVELRSADAEETLEDGWFAERRTTSSLPPPVRPFAPPINDDEVDHWLK